MVVVFDLDDTLYFEEDYVISAFKEISRITEEIEGVTIYNDLFNYYKEGKSQFDLVKEKYSINIPITTMVEIYRYHRPTLKPRAKVKDVLTTLQESKTKLCVVTDGRSITQRNKLVSLEILNFFDKVYISEEINSSKPNSLAFDKIIAHYKDQDSFVYIGDNIAKDFIKPNNLGWKTIMIEHSDRHIHPLLEVEEEFKPGHIVTSFDKILELIN